MRDQLHSLDDDALRSVVGGFSLDGVANTLKNTDWLSAARDGNKAGGNLATQGGYYGAIMGAAATTELTPVGMLAGAYGGYKFGRKAGYGLGFAAGAGENLYNQWTAPSAPAAGGGS